MEEPINQLHGLPVRQAKDLAETAFKEMLDPPKGIPLPWWPKLTKMLGGLRMKEVTLLCGATGAGKTSLLANISAQLFEAEIPHFVAPVETGDTDHMIRVLSALEREDYNTGDPVPLEKAKAMFKRQEHKIKNSPMYVATYSDRVNIEEMCSMLKYMNKYHGCKVALLDNLNFFMDVREQKDALLAMDDAIHGLIMLCKEIDMHILLVVHPRKTDGDGRVLSEFDIKGSSTAVQEAQNVLLYNRASKDELAPKGNRLLSDRELVFRKIRKRGMNVGRPIWLEYSAGRFDEIANYTQSSAGSDSSGVHSGSGGVLLQAKPRPMGSGVRKIRRDIEG